MNVHSRAATWLCRVMVAAWFAGIGGSAATAQSDSYQPSRPTVSPYMNLLRRDSGPLPNYYSLVRPQLQQNTARREQDATLQRQQSELRALGDRLGRAEAGPTVRPTGTASGFMNFSHYYGQSGGRRGGSAMQARGGQGSRGQTHRP